VVQTCLRTMKRMRSAYITCQVLSSLTCHDCLVSSHASYAGGFRVRFLNRKPAVQTVVSRRPSGTLRWYGRVGHSHRILRYLKWDVEKVSLNKLRIGRLVLELMLFVTLKATFDGMCGSFVSCLCGCGRVSGCISVAQNQI
jgi:hypothetical protein